MFALASKSSGYVGEVLLAEGSDVLAWSGGDRVEHGVELSIDLGGTPVEEECGGNAAILTLATG